MGTALTPKNAPSWRLEFSNAIGETLRDFRLWVIVLPSVAICGIALAFLNTWFAATISTAVLLIAARLINQIEQFPRPDEIALATTMYRSILLPSVIGIFVVTNSDLLARVLLMPWHWTHTISDIPPCGYLVTAVTVAWLGVPLTAIITALLTRERAVFATIVGLIVCIPLNLTFVLTGDHAAEFSSMFAKSCKIDLDPANDPAFSDGFSFGLVMGTVSQILIAVFVAKFVSALVTRKDSTTTNSSVR